jgi:hypothetical protein
LKRKKVRVEDLSEEEKKKVVEVKRNSAKDQLDLDVKVMHCILRMIGLEDSNFPPIKIMVSSPQEITEHDLKTKLSNNGIDFLHADSKAFEKNSQLIEKMATAAAESSQFEEKDYIRLISALAFLSNLYVTGKNYSIEESKMKLASQEGEKGREVSENLQTHLHLKEALPNSKTELGSVVVRLDPVQREIMKDKTSKRQVIVGPASTGKTILIQLKVMEIIETTTNEKVLIILPCKQLEEKYKDFFQNRNIDINRRVRFVTPDNKDWQQLLEENKDSHWFIDEFTALHAGHKDLCNQIIKRSK